MFAGALVPVDQMLGLAKGLAQLMMSKWSLELTGSIAHLAPRFETQFPAEIANPYRNAFDILPWTHWGVLVGFVVAMLAATLLAQKRKDRR